jgi:butyrate kinase
MYLQLIINPGSTSTKLALYRDEEKLVQEDVTHDSNELAKYKDIVDQVPMRMAFIQDFLARHNVDPKELSCVMGRGGLLPGLKAGGYLMNEDLKIALGGDLSSPHASNIGGILAYEIAKPLGIPAYIYDAVTSAELPRLARLTGAPDVYRNSFCHALNSRAQAIRYAGQLVGKEYQDLRLLVAHLGGGISLSAHVGGRIVETIGDDEGPFSPERAGAIPALELIKMCFSGKYTAADMKKMMRGKGGMMAYLGTSDARVIEKRIAEGDQKAKEIYEAQAYQVAKGIGLLSATMKGKVDAIILTGGMAYSKMLTGWISEYVSYIAPVVVLPGENEMEALAFGGIRLLDGKEQPNIYKLPEGYQV